MGAAKIKEKMPDAVSIFILPPSLAVLKSAFRGVQPKPPSSLKSALTRPFLK